MVYSNWEKLERYSNEDIEYKDEARKLICQSLGFEPPIHISMVAELTFRQNLKKIASGEISKKILDEQIEIQTNLIINTLIPKYAPELSEFVKRDS
ncbi:hypothetical protein [Flavivirga sp. 57AJ16]|uniref:hypothetical protein n=1 Tax=Flavivirga sp. 57AJ16 TaxID=3025307 RepID=UPI0023670F23|nr:hypothetical protein [Flavivirga sp. 57AJ16]MDD7887864.1 hypothetical protein [Flavivirga sp. 57AJ16]